MSVWRDTYPMIRLEVVNLLLEEDGPQVLAEEFDHVEVVGEAGTVTREPGGERELDVSMIFLFSLASALSLYDRGDA